MKRFRRDLICVIFASLAATIGLAQDSKVIVEKNVPFLEAGRDHKLDLHLPSDDSRSNALRPAILIVHGGGWHTGDKAAAREKNIGTNLAKAGFVCASVNYVLAKKTDSFVGNLEQVWPKNLQDCLKGVQFLRANAEKYRIDPEKVGAIGGSAGGHLVAMIGLIDESDGFDPKDGPHSKFSCRVQAVVPMYGVHDFFEQAKWNKIEIDSKHTELAKKASPVTYVSKDAPPFLLLHGTRDPLVNRKQSEILSEALEKVGAEQKLLIVTGAKHSFHLEPPQKDLKPIVIEFFNKHLKAKR